MKLFKNILESVKPHFLEGGKLEKMYPAYDAFETFLFVPNHTTHAGSHIRDAIDLKRTMITVVLALMPALFFGMWNVGQLHFTAIGEEFTLMSAFTFGALKMLPLIIVSYTVCYQNVSPTLRFQSCCNDLTAIFFYIVLILSSKSLPDFLWHANPTFFEP